MAFETKEDPENVLVTTRECKACRFDAEFKQEWRMGSRSSRRKNDWAIFREWMYCCSECGELEVVRYWQATPTEPMFADRDFK